MRITRIYTDSHGDSVFEDLDISLTPSGTIGSLSSAFDVEKLILRETPGDYDYDFHNAPQRQFIILLDGEIEVENSKGETRRFKTGDILLVEDVKGKGHRTRSIDGHLRRSVFISMRD